MLKLARLANPAFLQHSIRLPTLQQSTSSHLPSSSPNAEYVPLLPEGTNRKIFQRKPADPKQRQRFVELKKDIIYLSKCKDSENTAYRLQRYILENPTSHYVSLQCIQQMSITFASTGDVDRCREMLDLAQQLVRNRKLNSVQDTNHARIVVNYLFSLMNCPDKSRGVQGVREFYEKVKDQQRKYHPVVLDGLSKVLMSFGMTREVDELLKLAPSTEIQSPSAVLQLADSLLERGFVGDAARLLDSHSDFVDMRILNADQYALLAKVLTGVYGRPTYKQISRFCRENSSEVKNFAHFPIPLSKNLSLCRNYEIVLHVAAKRQVRKLFRIVGGRNGLTRQLEHISCFEYVLMVQYIVQLCSHYHIPVDEPFWNYLFFSFFRVEKKGFINYADVRELTRTINFYPLTSEMWCTIIDHVRENQLYSVYLDLIACGMMDDKIYTALITRSSADSQLHSELQMFSDDFSVISSSAKPAR
ncbi:hypothetical protein ACHWQZ_G009519 [Mnemiopsis leidyi]